ncbi:MAG: hypothetical protein IJ601_06045 [Acidaminococcaceae bacterium]|nr:hypothetical protein [Acidaminococcaceae bacterium]
MNKVYRIIWSKTKNCWIVVSEIAKRHGKAAARKGGTAVLGGLVAASLLAGMAVCRPVWAEQSHNFGTSDNTISYDEFYDESMDMYQTPRSMVVWGSGNTVQGAIATVWGENNLARGVHSTAWGNHNESLGGNSTAFGIGTKAIRHESTAFGGYTYAGEAFSTAWGISHYNRDNISNKIGARGCAGQQCNGECG